VAGCGDGIAGALDRATFGGGDGIGCGGSAGARATAGAGAAGLGADGASIRMIPDTTPNPIAIAAMPQSTTVHTDRPLRDDAERG